jgi:hypothetical protein
VAAVKLGDSAEGLGLMGGVGRPRRDAAIEYVGPPHDEGLAHDARYSRLDPRGCPLLCPARPGLLARKVGEFPALPWAEQGSPVMAVWWGGDDVVDQVHAGLPVALADNGDGRLVLHFAGRMHRVVPMSAPVRLGPADAHDRSLLLHESLHASGCDGAGCRGCSLRASTELRMGNASLELSSGSRGSGAGVVPQALLPGLLPSRAARTVEDRLAAARRMPVYDPQSHIEAHLARLARGLAGDVEQLQARARRIGAGVEAALDAFEQGLSDWERARMEDRLRRLRGGVLAALADGAGHRTDYRGGDHRGAAGMVAGQGG